jgi:hypothetical protein
MYLGFITLHLKFHGGCGELEASTLLGLTGQWPISILVIIKALSQAHQDWVLQQHKAVRTRLLHATSSKATPVESVMHSNGSITCDFAAPWTGQGNAAKQHGGIDVQQGRSRMFKSKCKPPCIEPPYFVYLFRVSLIKLGMYGLTL